MKKTQIPKIVKQIQDFKPKEINWATEKGISFSQLSMYLSCPKKWSLQYKEGQKVYNASINMTFGTSIHETVQNYISVMYNQSGVEADDIDLEKYFEERFRENYAREYKSNKNIHFSSPSEMKEFYDDGLAILEFIKRKRGEYFSKRGWWLVGIEIPIVISPDKRYNNVYFNGFIDLVLYHEPTNKFVIYDIKTSKQSWGDKAKKDKIKQTQILLYKSYFSEQFGVDMENIDVKFFILKRKIWEESEFPQGRIQVFSPPSGKTSINKSKQLINSFIQDIFNLNGTYTDKEHLPNPDEYNCKYCPYNNQSSLCNKGKTS